MCIYSMQIIAQVYFSIEKSLLISYLKGSVMIMFEGYFGRILHTGDMRFNKDLITNNKILYPTFKANKSEQLSL